MRRHRLVLPVLAALALTACSGGSDPQAGPASSPQGGSAPDAAAAEAVKAAARDTTATGSSKFELSSTTAVGGQDVTFAGRGAFDYDDGTGQLTFQVPGAGGASSGGGSIEERVVGPDLFLTLPQMPGTFYRLKVADVAGTSLGSSTDPTASLSALLGVAAVQQVGKEQVRGVEATHYEGTYDVRAAIAGAPADSRAVLAQTLGTTSLQQVPFDAFLDSEGRLVKFEQELELAATTQTRGQKVTSRTVLELFEFGTVVTVKAPPAASVKDGAPLLAALRAAEPKSRGKQEPAASPSP